MNRKIGLVFSYGVMITEIVSAMFVTPFIIRSLGQAEYGIYQLTSSITAYLIIFDLVCGHFRIFFYGTHKLAVGKIRL